MNNEVIQGELGWWTMKARRDELRLRYWRKIVHMKDERIPRIIYEQSRARLEQESKEGTIITDTWCEYTKKLLLELKLERYWNENRALDEESWAKL